MRRRSVFDRGITGVWISAEILKLQGLTLSQKVLLSLAAEFGQTGLCLSNADLAELVGTDRRHLIRVLNRLRSKGYLFDAGADKQHRRLVVSSDKMPLVGKPSSGKNVTTSSDKMSPPRTPTSDKKTLVRALSSDLITTQKKKRRREDKGASAPSEHKQFMEFFCGEYQGTTGRKYIVSGAKDGNLVKLLLGKLSLDELKQATQNMLADSWGRERASIGLLSSQINTWLALFNLIPFGPLDGAKILRWNKGIWLITIAGAGGLFVIQRFFF